MTWDPRKLSAEASAGGAERFSADLLFDEPTDGLGLFVAPQLADIVSVTPPVVPSLSAGEVFTVQITVAPPEGTPARFPQGTIHVRSAPPARSNQRDP
ncbi:hypothetical protein [Sedimentimonas flavescens]|uniref:hypothetical protein n=1 Tax=Sedimentimonas flavescens TaxID=2851012 RepID=UPI0021A4D811|nr:hypothetical protein [Sedimentimonas flavescens]MCT2541077.1 hypothetical protein [Sedimentimonas flavescens]WBL33076.1 hypothetical protein O5O51_15400 [Sinirhodobacter sp. HNIBRBA609]